MTCFSFIIPVYNVERYIGKCIDSVLIQTYNDFEVILIDDGSTDSSGFICDEYAKSDSRVRVFHEKNQGVSKARNKGIEMAKGKYIIFLDSDDYWISNKLELIAKKCDKYNPDIIAYNYEVYDESTSKIITYSDVDFKNISDNLMTGEKYLKDIFKNNRMYSWYPWFYVIKKEKIVDFELYFKPDTKYEDADLMYRIILKANKVIILDESILRYRIKREGAITNSINVNTEIDKLNVATNNIQAILSMSIDNELKKILCNSFSCLYYSALIICNDIESMNERKKLLKHLKNCMWICKYTTIVNQRIVYYLIKVIGINNVCSLLHIRKKIKNRK